MSEPDLFATVTSVLPWQRQQWQAFTQALQAERLPHAILLAGAAGLGKLHFAAAMAAHLVCEGTLPMAEGAVACGQCHSCRMRQAGHHPDIMSIMPAEQGRMIRIDAIREINDFLAQTAQQGGYRLVVIQGADAMTVGAANALLKRLEEPGARTLFILTSDLPSRVLPTILSRCQRWNCSPPALTECRPWLIEQLDDADEADFWWRVSGGAPLRAVTLGKGERRQLRQKMVELFESLVRGGEPVAEAARLDKQPLVDVLDIGIAWLEDLIRFGLSAQSDVIKNPDILSLYRQAVKNGRVRDWFRLLDYAREQRRLLASGGNPNPSLVLEAWLIRWSALLRS